MKILFVCSKNSGRVVPFIVEQAESIRRLGHTVEFFAIEGKGIFAQSERFHQPIMPLLMMFAAVS